MKTLYLVRHAKSDWENRNLLDIERHLNERGYSNANMMSKSLKEKKITPNLIISSPAVRALSTALIFARNLNYSPNTILIKEELYETSVKDYLSVISTIKDEFNTIFLFAHNPTISSLADALTKTLPIEMPTCALAGINFDMNSWADIKIKKGELFLFDYPKKHE